MTNSGDRLLGFLALALFVFLVSSCREGTEPAKGMFYFWRTTLDMSSVERNAMTNLGTAPLRVRLFDVVFDGVRARPVGTLRVAPSAKGLEVLPVVFLREKVFHDTQSVADLAANLLAERDTICHRGGLVCRGLELDCDWNASSQAGFFRMAAILRDSLHARGESIRSTVRLHQFAKPTMAGVPPVDRTTLMVYNMGRLSAKASERSILDLAELDKWLPRKAAYPLPVDVALPLYSWTIQIREGKPVDLLQETSPDDLEQNLSRLEVTDSGTWCAKEGFFLQGHWIRQGDVLKTEEVANEDLETAAKRLGARLPASDDREVVYFDLRERNLRHHDQNTLVRLLGIFGGPGGGDGAGLRGR